MRRIEDQSFLLLLLVVSIAFGWILQPFYGAILWATAAAVIFAPLNRKLLVRTGERPGIAALVTVLIIIAMVILPLAMIAASLTQEASNLYAKVQSGEYDFARYIQRIFDALPAWATGLLDRFNLNNLPAVRDWLASGAMKGGQVLAPQALSIGMNTFDFLIGLGIMLYLLFFLLRDGKALADRIKRVVPLRADQKAALFGRFADVVRATVKGGILVAIAQGTLGGLAFWFLGIHAPLVVGGVDGLPVPPAGHRIRPGLGARCDLPVGQRRRVAGRCPDRVRGARHRTGGQSSPSIPDRERRQAARLCRADFHAGRH